MKKKNSFLRNFLIFFSYAVIVLFVHVILLAEINSMTKKKKIRQDELVEKINKIEEKKIEVQKLTSEERITQTAKDTLGLNKAGIISDSIIIDKKQLEYIINKMNEKYGK